MQINFPVKADTLEEMAYECFNNLLAAASVHGAVHSSKMQFDHMGKTYQMEIRPLTVEQEVGK